MNKGRLILYSGPSGVGKGTVRHFFIDDPRFNLHFSTSFTTRPKRTQEKEGKDYFFVTIQQFQKMISQEAFLEWALFAGHYYGTSQKVVEKALNQGQNIILEIEVIGAKQVLQKHPDCLSLFLLPPSLTILKQRLVSRNTENKQAIAARLQKAKKELQEQNLYQYQIINDDAAVAAEKIKQILAAELERS